MISVLIIGGSGYLGQMIVKHLALQNSSNNNNNQQEFLYNVSYTYYSQKLFIKENNDNNNNDSNSDSFLDRVHAYKVNLVTGEGLSDALYKNNDNDSNCKMDIVINCAAISQPVVCENDTETALKVNVPELLLTALNRNNNNNNSCNINEPLLIHISTDNVYNGINVNNNNNNDNDTEKDFFVYSENDELDPINVYGRTKKLAEEVIREKYKNHGTKQSKSIMDNCL